MSPYEFETEKKVGQKIKILKIPAGVSKKAFQVEFGIAEIGLEIVRVGQVEVQRFVFPRLHFESNATGGIGRVFFRDERFTLCTIPRRVGALALETNDTHLYRPNRSPVSFALGGHFKGAIAVDRSRSGLSIARLKHNRSELQGFTSISNLAGHGRERAFLSATGRDSQ